MGLFGKKNKNKEKGVPFWRRNKQQAEEETVLEPEEQTAEMVDAEAEEDIAAAALNDLAAQEQDEIEKARISLPFFSYGGTALILQLAEMGIVLNISRVRYQSPQRAPAAERAPQAEVQLQGGNV